MTLFVDTSAILALVDRDDPSYDAVSAAFARGRQEPLVTHAYIVVESLAVSRRRFGTSVSAAIIDFVLPNIAAAPVDQELHDIAVRAFREAIESNVSLVDRTSFAFMRQQRIGRAIALDRDFQTAGFQTLPPVDET